MLLIDPIGDTQAANRIERALAAVLREKTHVTRDPGGSAGTRRMTGAIVEKLSEG